MKLIDANNKPLTTTELQKMDGEPVWVSGSDWNCWAVLCDAKLSAGIVAVSADKSKTGICYHMAGTGIRFYRRKPIKKLTWERLETLLKATGISPDLCAEILGISIDAGESENETETITANTKQGADNKPLTFDELCKMGGQPVWVKGGDLDRWALIHIIPDKPTYPMTITTPYIENSCMYFDCSCMYLLRKGAKFYRKPPQEDKS